MIAPLLLLAHGVVGLLALPTMFLPSPWRQRVLTGLCVVGAGFGVALVVANGSLDQWRAFEIRGIATIAGSAIAAAWLVAALLSARAGRWLACALVGVAASAMALAVMSEWVVPTLLFWLCSSLAIAGLAAQERAGTWVWVPLFASDVALVAALLGNWIDTRSWGLPDSLEGWPFYVLVIAAVLRVGAVPLAGTWNLLGRASAAIPLLVGGGFAVLRVALGRPDPWSASVLFLAALAVAVTLVVATRPWGGIAAAAAASIAVLLGLALLAPSALAAAGAAAVVVAAVAALWLAAPDEGAPERVVALVAVPPTLAFVAASAGVAAAIRNTVGAEDMIDKVPWTLALVAALVALTANLAVAVRLAAAIPPGSGWLERVRAAAPGALAILVARLLIVFSIAGAVMPGEWLGIESPSAAWSARRAILLAVALVVAAAAVWFALRTPTAVPARAPVAASPFEASPWLGAPTGTIAGRVLIGVALLFAVGAIAAVGWLTFEGLRLGFL